MDIARDSRLQWVSMVLALALFAWAAVWISGVGVVTDEHAHYPRAVGFARGDSTVFAEYTPMPPGYHVLASSVMRVTGSESLTTVRLVSVFFGLVGALAFLGIRRQHGDGRALLATAQLLILPLIFPFYFLAYTDVLSASLALVGAWAALRSWHVVAGVVLAAATVVRQNNVVTSAFIAVVAAWPTLAVTPAGRWIPVLLPRFWAYVLPVAVFVAVFVIYGGVTAAPALAALAPPGRFDFGNLFLLPAAGALLLPLHTALGWRAMTREARSRPWLWLVPLALMVAFLLLFRADHPLNAPVAEGHELFLRARLFKAMDAHWLVRGGVGVIAVAGICGLAFNRLHADARWVWPAFALLFLGTQWMIDVRYQLIPAVFWLAFRQLSSDCVEFATALWWCALSAWLMAGIVAGAHFP
ncbi:Dol-P-Glc:Glc(2)Man(9)GlcNAc(2)-PP-Dol alpha-1,2-glucosyltransferase [Tahibacter amnicola]|uniref:Dol-P-Glc:Glc(2)Man(9)GlcNAc(2)-PP-Dol alpha-1,2-glucosyltransferase n=1 Tax=Tahibacter amnicola TaxID=2976241 RepID=A0ABY6BHM5_9GAMM|nr:Dol-P-Glc:Glc(2)Man(9)GlcNAc(2)-PP-Dol alpha-1,2-glucosyltransferase [Tahibacter amnicola]UXI67362.1 Dol-P-Glc:Glc(2)Man(9)GlcNAc(2)-PP-Dol alpha-1,2-glucosyltransferase [Tahibacter amnicola]